MTATHPRPSAWSTVGLIAPFALYAAYCAARADLRVEHILLLATVVLAHIGPRSRQLLVGLLPLGLVAVLFDAMRPFQKVGLTESGVHLCDLRSLESTLFGYGKGDEARTLHDFFLVHHHPVVDVLCAVPYATFILWCVAGAVFLYFKDRASMVRFAWGFFLLNVAGFVTYHLLPAAPPWYFHAHGCVVDLATRASEGPALARVDALLGVPYFHGMYSKASSVFGAIPSLHCAYPMLLVLEGYRTFGPRLRAATIAYWMAMVFSAVYLDHHWVIDALVGSAYAVIVFFVVRSAPRLVARGKTTAAIATAAETST